VSAREDTTKRRDETALFLVLAAFCLGLAVHVRDGLVHPGAIVWLSLSIFLAFLVFTSFAGHWSRAIPAVLAAAVLTQFAVILFSKVPGGWNGERSTVPYYAGVAAAACAAVAMVIWPRSRHALFPVMLVCFALVGVWLLRVGGRPRIDVWTSQMAGLEALCDGHDPWSSSFPDVYHKPGLYADGTARDGMVHLGFPYPPLSVLLDLPGFLLLHDFRYGNLVTMLAAAAFIAYAQPRSSLGPLLAALFLFTPRSLLVLRNGWTEPQVAMLLAATVFCACHMPRAMPWVLGLLLVSKQYMFLAAAPAVLFLEPPWSVRRIAAMFLRAGIAGSLVTLPLALWNYTAYMRSNFLVAGGAGFRMDALSYFAYFGNIFDWPVPTWLGGAGFLAAAIATVVVLRCGERSPAGFAVGVAIVFLIFFSLNKFAFCNYYYFVIAALCTSAAAGVEVRTTATKASPVSPDNGELPLALAA
jgi:hypothetical protein